LSLSAAAQKDSTLYGTCWHEDKEHRKNAGHRSIIARIIARIIAGDMS